MDFFIYKYIENEEIVYIGQTTDLIKRVQQHTKDKLKNFHGSIYYFKCENKTEMNSWEFFLIQKYHPKYNIVFNDSSKNIDCTEPEWYLYKTNNMEIKDLKVIDISNFIKQPVINTKSLKQSNTRIIQGPARITFRCKHCRTTFETSNWRRTKGGHYSANCPCCPYAAWAK